MTPAIAGFIKGLLTVLVLTLVSYLADAANLTGVVNPTIAVVVAALFSSIESALKAQSGGTTALFGMARIG